MSSSTSRHRRGHAPKDSGISMAAKPEPDAATTPPPSLSSSKKQVFFICDRCMRPRAAHRRLPYRKNKFTLCDYCYQPKNSKEVRDASIIFEMVWCRQGDHEAPVINFKDRDDNWSCCHCKNRITSHPSKPLPERSLRVRPDSEPELDHYRGGKGAAAMAAASGLGMKQHQHPHLVPDQRRQQEERPQIQYYSGSYKPRGQFENSSRPPKTLQTFHPQVRPPNMGNYIIKSHASAPLPRLDPKTELRSRPQPQPQPKMRAVHGSRTYHAVPNPNQETPPKARQRPSMTSHHEQQAMAPDDILKTIPPPSKAVSANRTPKLKAQAQAHHHHKPQQQKPPPQEQQQRNQRPPPLSPIDIPPLVPSFESPMYHYQPHHPSLPQRQKQPPQPPPAPPKRPRPKTQYEKPPAGPAWELMTRREQEQRQKHYRRPTNALRRPASTESEERARADSETLGPQTTCPCCHKHRPTYSELIEAYGFCFHCLRRHLVAAGELLKCPSCRRLQTRQDFVKYDRDGLVVERRTAECLGCQWWHRKGAKLSAALCGGLT